MGMIAANTEFDPTGAQTHDQTLSRRAR